MLHLTRRRLLAASSLLLTQPFLSACGVQRRRPDTGSSLHLLYYADTHAQWLPVTPHPAANHLGPVSLLGQPPWITEQKRLEYLGLTAEISAAAWLTASGARRQHSRLGDIGGYAALSRALADYRRAQGTDACLTLEGGQCWNGSGLAQLTEGHHGPLSSHWLGADVRIASEEQRLWPEGFQTLYRSLGRPVLDVEQPVARFKRSGVDIAVVGVVDPWLQWPQGFDERLWLLQIQQQVNRAAASSQLVILLCDAGTGPALWLARQLEGVDLILSSRGQDLWPHPVVVQGRHESSIPVVLAGSQAQGFFSLVLQADGDRWQIKAEFHPLWQQLAAVDESVAGQIRQLRAPYASWLEQPLARAPGWLYRRDALAGSWDQLMAEAIREQGAPLSLMPGLRHGLAVAPGQPITRDHLISLTGGYAANLFSFAVNRNQLMSRLEAGADQMLGSDWFLHASEDLPRLSGAHYLLRYQAGAGQRIAELDWPAPTTREQVQLTGWSQHYRRDGVPLWQVMEQWLRSRPAGWQLPDIERPSLAFVEGHPGWHPEVLES